MDTGLLEGGKLLFLFFKISNMKYKPNQAVVCLLDVLFVFQPAFRLYSCVVLLAAFLLLTSRQFSHSTEMFCT